MTYKFIKIKRDKDKTKKKKNQQDFKRLNN